LGYQWGTAWALDCLAEVALVEGDLMQAEALCKEALTLARGVDHQERVISIALYTLGQVLFKRGKLVEAQQQWAESLQMSEQLGEKQIISLLLEAFGWLAQDTHQESRAVQIYAAAQKLRRSIGFVLPPRESRELADRVAALQSSLGEAAYQDLWGEGEAMSTDEAIACVLASPD
jgi:hypothetical protein